MIPLIIALALCFAWACIATAVAVQKATEAKLWENGCDKRDAQLASKEENIAALLDRQMASTLGEYHAARSVAMPARDPAPERRVYASDPTGIFQVPLEDLPPVDTDDE